MFLSVKADAACLVRFAGFGVQEGFPAGLDVREGKQVIICKIGRLRRNAGEVGARILMVLFLEPYGER